MRDKRRLLAKRAQREAGGLRGGGGGGGHGLFSFVENLSFYAHKKVDLNCGILC